MGGDVSRGYARPGRAHWSQDRSGWITLLGGLVILAVWLTGLTLGAGPQQLAEIPQPPGQPGLHGEAHA